MDLETLFRHRPLASSFELSLLVGYVLKKSREFVLAHPEKLLTKQQAKRLDLLIARRKKGEPIAYLTKQKEFFALEFSLNKHTLIPRPESELMVLHVIEKIKNANLDAIASQNETKSTLLKNKVSRKLVVDVGTGSGCIIISLAQALSKKYAGLTFFATDISKNAVAIAKKNASRHHLEKKITFSTGNLLQPLLEKNTLLKNVEQLILTANLPYLSKKIYQSAPVDVKNYEPKTALLSGSDGLDHYRALLKQIKNIKQSFLNLMIIVYLEISPEQKKLIEKEISLALPQAQTQIKKDLAKKSRLVIIQV